MSEKKYDPLMVLGSTADIYSPNNRNLIMIHIEIKDSQKEWFRLYYRNNMPMMSRGPRHATSGRKQDGHELATEKKNLGKVEIEIPGKIEPFDNYDEFWEKINK